MAYNKNTDWDNERKYLDNLSKNGNAGQKAWAESQKKTLAAAQAQYGGSSGGGSSSGGSGSSGGGTTSGGSSSNKSSGSSNKNSQYTAPTLGNTWDANTDYQSIINNAVANGDYVTAAKAEQLRNQKITGTGSNYNTTNMYAGYLDNTDYGTIGQQQMANNASWQDVQDTLDSRVNKALNTAGLEKYAYDDVYRMMYNYIQDQKNAEIIAGYEDKIAELENDRPEEYESKYDPRIDKLLNEILNRDDFSYDAMNDPLYQQYANMYRREGDRAMKETLAEAAAGAGGMNTYAITAAQQANSYYNSQLNDRIPELYQLAYNMYLNDKESKVQDLGILQDMDATQYNRYRDTINDFYNDRNFAYGAYQDAVQQGNWQTNFDNNNYWANKEFDNNNYWANKEFDYNDMWANKEWNEGQADKEYERNQTEQEKAYNQIIDYISLGVTSFSDEELAKAGIDRTKLNQMIAYYKAQQAQTGGTSSGGGRSKESDTGYTGNDKEKVVEEDTGYKPKVKEEEDEGEVDTSRWDASGNYVDIDEACKSLLMTKGKSEVLAYLKRTLEEGAIDIYSYMTLVNKYRN